MEVIAISPYTEDYEDGLELTVTEINISYQCPKCKSILIPCDNMLLTHQCPRCGSEMERMK